MKTTADKSLDLVTIGDSTIDTFVKIHDATVQCDINHQDCKICVPYGSKIPVDAIAHRVAGNAANVAVGAARLGLSVAINTNLGDDESGAKILKALEENEIDTEFVKINKDKASNLSVVLTFQGERTIFVYHQSWSYTLPNLGQVSWIYLTSMAETFSDSNIMNEVCHFIEKSRAKLVFSPGTYQLKIGVKNYPKILERCELLIVNLEEAKTILGIEQAALAEPKDLLAKLLLLGPKKIVITNGAEGSYATDGKKNFKLGIMHINVVEKTGTGDAYSSGLVSALVRGKKLDEAMVWGTINAAFEMQHVGTQIGLLTLENLKKELKKNSKFKAVSF